MCYVYFVSSYFYTYVWIHQQDRPADANDASWYAHDLLEDEADVAPRSDVDSDTNNVEEEVSY